MVDGARLVGYRVQLNPKVWEQRPYLLQDEARHGHAMRDQTIAPLETDIAEPLGEVDAVEIATEDGRDDHIWTELIHQFRGDIGEFSESRPVACKVGVEP